MSKDCSVKKLQCQRNAVSRCRVIGQALFYITSSKRLPAPARKYSRKSPQKTGMPSRPFSCIVYIIHQPSYDLHRDSRPSIVQTPHYYRDYVLMIMPEVHQLRKSTTNHSQGDLELALPRRQSKRSKADLSNTQEHIRRDACENKRPDITLQTPTTLPSYLNRYL